MRSVSDVASFLGISQDELTPAVRAGLERLIKEVDKLRRELVEKQERISHLERLADEDPLTPILNRRAFVRELSRMIAHAERYGSYSSVIYVDVNDMKQINDVYGHAAGDAALTHLADLLLANVRASDVVGRLGGDEFAILLAEAGEDAASEKAEQLTGLIAETPIQWDDNNITISVSAGTFAFDGKREPDEVLHAADQVMYEQKRSKRPSNGGTEEPVNETGGPKSAVSS
ncbi:MAG: GGDEF domain-containing protein [Pseudomonadota bacterium]